MLEIIKNYKKNKKFRNIDRGTNVFIDYSVDIYTPEMLTIENNVSIQFGCKLFATGGGITIGEGTILAHDVQILSRNHYYDGEDLKYIPYDERFINKRVVIGKYCWIGARVTILPGTEIGDGVVIGAGAVVSGRIDSYAVCAGNPAKVIKYRDKDIFLKLFNEGKGYIANTKHY